MPILLIKPYPESDQEMIARKSFMIGQSIEVEGYKNYLAEMK